MPYCRSDSDTISQRTRRKSAYRSSIVAPLRSGWPFFVPDRRFAFSGLHKSSTVVVLPLKPVTPTFSGRGAWQYIRADFKRYFAGMELPLQTIGPQAMPHRPKWPLLSCLLPSLYYRRRSASRARALSASISICAINSSATENLFRRKETTSSLAVWEAMRKIKHMGFERYSVPFPRWAIAKVGNQGGQPHPQRQIRSIHPGGSFKANPRGAGLRFANPSPVRGPPFGLGTRT